MFFINLSSEILHFYVHLIYLLIISNTYNFILLGEYYVVNGDTICCFFQMITPLYFAANC